MQYRIDYKVNNKLTIPELCDVTLDGEAGKRFDSISVLTTLFVWQG